MGAAGPSIQASWKGIGEKPDADAKKDAASALSSRWLMVAWYATEVERWRGWVCFARKRLSQELAVAN
jgi:hypothetical protein